MNVFLHEVKANSKATIGWIFSLCSMMGVFMLFFPLLQTEMGSFLSMLDNFPPAFKAAFGFNTEVFDSALGYYTFTFTYAALFGAIQAMNFGIGILSKEERERTADFLMTKPVSRHTVFTAKTLCAIAMMVITNILYTATALPVVASYSGKALDISKFLLINASLLFLQLVLFAIGLAISVMLKKVKSVLPVSLGLVFMFFAISAFAVTSKDDKLRYLTPFQYFKVDNIVLGDGFETRFVVLACVLFVFAMITAYCLFRRRDMHSV